MSHHIIGNLLGDDGAADLLAYAIANEALFIESGVGPAGELAPKIRRSRRLPDLGPFQQPVAQRVTSMVPELVTKLGLTWFSATDIEMEIVAHQDGAFYARHIDLMTGTSRAGQDRLISMVCYLNLQPKAYSGGELRLYPSPRPVQNSAENTIDIVPEHGLAVAFSSWLPHEVRPVVCPSPEFRHSRFAINCWVRRSLDLVACPVPDQGAGNAP